MTYAVQFTDTQENYPQFKWTSTYSYLKPIPDGMSAQECLEYLEEKYGKVPKGICICVSKDGGYELRSERFNEEHLEWRKKLKEFRESNQMNCSGDYVRV
jgi:hypothetical protein